MALEGVNAASAGNAFNAMTPHGEAAGSMPMSSASFDDSRTGVGPVVPMESMNDSQLQLTSGNLNMLQQQHHGGLDETSAQMLHGYTQEQHARLREALLYSLETQASFQANHGQLASGISPTDQSLEAMQLAGSYGRMGQFDQSAVQSGVATPGNIFDGSGHQYPGYWRLGQPTPEISSSSMDSLGRPSHIYAPLPFHPRLRSDPTHQYSNLELHQVPPQSPDSNNAWAANHDQHPVPSFHDMTNTNEQNFAQWNPALPRSLADAQASLQHLQGEYREPPQLRHSVPSTPLMALWKQSQPQFMPQAQINGQYAPYHQQCAPPEQDGLANSQRKRKREVAMTEEERRDVFLERNRAAAAKCRNKKKVRDQLTLTEKQAKSRMNQKLLVQREGLLADVLRLKDALLESVENCQGCTNETVQDWLKEATSEQGRAKFKDMIRDHTDMPEIRAKKRLLQSTEPGDDVDAAFEAEMENTLGQEDEDIEKQEK